MHGFAVESPGAVAPQKKDGTTARPLLWHLAMPARPRIGPQFASSLAAQTRARQGLPLPDSLRCPPGLGIIIAPLQIHFMHNHHIPSPATHIKKHHPLPTTPDSDSRVAARRAFDV